jgi:hypothetical protein
VEYSDEQAKAIWRGLWELIQDPNTAPDVKYRANILWENFLYRNRS